MRKANIQSQVGNYMLLSAITLLYIFNSQRFALVINLLYLFYLFLLVINILLDSIIIFII